LPFPIQNITAIHQLLKFVVMFFDEMFKIIALSYFAVWKFKIKVAANDLSGGSKAKE
jgi:hypothetical protein